MTGLNQQDDKVTRLIRYCHGDRQQAEAVFNHLITRKSMSFELPEGEMVLSPEEHDEFVERFSAEVEPTIWESKRLKN
ncbi:MAG: hypothetical protein C0624_12965 [Desulfuromonas sp.]|nr:MAG: hypothetical protein C0624_12965 [Desulfuromonas sp.]